MKFDPRVAAAFAAAILTAGTASVAPAAEDAGALTPAFKPGDVITFQDLEKLRPFLPEEFWNNRDFFFYEGMKLEVAPPGDYSPAAEFKAATEKFRGQARIGPDNSIENYTAGMPFPQETIDCKGDPQAGVKWMWNFDNQWDGDGARSSFFYSYWDRGEQLPLYYEGSAKTIKLSNRIEKEYLESNGGDLFRGEKRKNAFGVQVDAPFDARGIMLMSYRYKASDMPRSEAKNDDTWVYVPTLRRVRRISTAQRTDAVSGTDFTFDDLRSFAGIVPQYEWQCLGERKIIAPMNTKVKAYPYEKDHNFGPYGLSFASDRWELRDAVVIRFIPKNSDHPYHHKDIYIDKQTLTALYSFAYDQKEELWKIIWHNKRWSEDTSLTGEWYTGWDGVAKPDDLRYVSDIIVNVQTGTGNRIEFWDSDGMPMKSKGKIRRFIDVGRLTKGREREAPRPPMAEPIEPFRIRIPDAVLADLRERLARTRWPDTLEGSGWSYGTDLAYLKELCAYWRDGFDWRAQEAALNRFAQFTTPIDGERLHFVHQRSPAPGALPLVVTHGWPGSIAEFPKILGPLSDPAAHGGDPRDAFHVVCPSMPGYGFSGPTHSQGWDIRRVAAANAALMQRLGYARYGAQGGDWGAAASTQLAMLVPERLVGIHLNFVLAGPPQDGSDPFEGVTPEERAALAATEGFESEETGYQRIQGTRPQTLAYGLNDSPAGLAGWIVEKFRAWSDCKGDVESRFTKDELLTNITIYWVTQTIHSSTRLYCETMRGGRWGMTQHCVTVPTGCAIFPGEMIQPPRRWAERYYPIRRWTRMASGGHFAALEEPEALVDEIRAFFRELR